MTTSQQPEANPGKGNRGFPRVGVVILNWNGLAHLKECIPSVLESSYPNFFVILVDNASEDDSIPWIGENAPNIIIIPNRENLGFARGNNAGIERALLKGADYILILNNDTAVDPSLIGEMVRIAETDHDIGVVGPKIYYWEEGARLWFAGGKIDFLRGKIYHHGVRCQDGPRFDEIREVDYITGCALMIRRAAVERIGLLDPSYEIYTEDVDWCQRARLAGYRILYCPSARMRHRISASTGGGLTPFKIYHKVRSNFLFFRRYAKIYHWPTIILSVAIGAIGFMARSILGGNSRAIVPLMKAFRDNLRPRRRG